MTRTASFWDDIHIGSPSGWSGSKTRQVIYTCKWIHSTSCPLGLLFQSGLLGLEEVIYALICSPDRLWTLREVISNWLMVIWFQNHLLIRAFSHSVTCLRTLCYSFLNTSSEWRTSILVLWILWTLVKTWEICRPEVNACHVNLILFQRDRWIGFLAYSSFRCLLSHQAVDFPVIVGELSSLFEVIKDFLAKNAEFTCQRNLCNVYFCQVNLARII